MLKGQQSCTYGSNKNSSLIWDHCSSEGQEHLQPNSFVYRCICCESAAHKHGFLLWDPGRKYISLPEQSQVALKWPMCNLFGARAICSVHAQFAYHGMSQDQKLTPHSGQHFPLSFPTPPTLCRLVSQPPPPGLGTRMPCYSQGDLWLWRYCVLCMCGTPWSEKTHVLFADR